MMNSENFKKGIFLFLQNFNFSMEDEYIALVYKFLSSQGITDEQFENIVNKMILTKKKGDFFGRPAVADWLDMLGKKTLTDEQKNVQRASEVMVWLDGGCNYDTWRDYPCYVWGSGYKYCKENPYDNLKKDPVIMAMITDHFGGSSGIIDRFLEQKNTGYTELFRKELIEFMGISEITIDETLMIGSDEDTVKKIDGCLGMLTDKFNANRRLK